MDSILPYRTGLGSTASQQAGAEGPVWASARERPAPHLFGRAPASSRVEEEEKKKQMLEIARATGSETIVQGPIITFLFPNKFFVLLEQLKNYFGI